ncbi:MAG: hypothetical protein ABUL62_21850 [Myxococcales bacterium]|jgi:hypothetical protein
MSGPRETAAKGAKACALVSSAAFVLGGCSYTSTTQTVKSPVIERRTPVDATCDSNEPDNTASLR